MADSARALGWALTGVDLGMGPGEPADAALVVAWLNEQGWSAEQVQEHRAQCQAHRQPWPHQVPVGWVEQWARHGSLLGEVRALLGVDGLRSRVRSGSPVLGAAERRLLADKPPHHGSV